MGLPTLHWVFAHFSTNTVRMIFYQKKAAGNFPAAFLNFRESERLFALRWSTWAAWTAWTSRSALWHWEWHTALRGWRCVLDFDEF
jgi:hypothetical protein